MGRTPPPPITGKPEWQRPLADLQMVNRYVKLLPQPGETGAADRLNAYLRRIEEE